MMPLRARTRSRQEGHRRPLRLQALFAIGLGAALLLALGCSQGDPMVQRTFSDPEDAVQALQRALETDDVDPLLSLLGRQYQDRIVTPDWDAEGEARQQISAALRERHELQELGDGELQLVVGAKEWPFPIPLLREEDGAWRFDTEEGIETVLDRRIGRNELTAIRLVDAYVDAQIEYARLDRDGDGVREYAQRLVSSPGKRDGLYWEAAADEKPSPFGPLVEGAEAYLETRDPGDPLYGYYFKVLTGQGGAPPGGAYDYVINGNMIAGFALVAYPADYGNSGVMSFVVNQRGKIQQKDLGPFDGMELYDPDDPWDEVEVDAES